MFLTPLVSIYKKEIQAIEIKNKAEFVPGAVDKRANADDFTIESGDVLVGSSGKKFVVESTTPVTLKDVVTGKKVIASDFPYKLVEASKDRYKGWGSWVKDYCDTYDPEIVSKEKCFKEACNIGLRVTTASLKAFQLMSPAQYKTIYALANNYSPKVGDKVITSSDLISGADISNPNIRKEIVAVLSPDKIKLKMKDGQQVEMATQDVSDINPKRFAKVLRNIYSNWDKYVTNGKINIEAIKANDSYTKFVTYSFREAADKLKAMVNRSVYSSSVVNLEKSGFRKGDKVVQITSKQKGIFMGYDTAVQQDNPTYAFVTFGSSEPPARVELADIDFDETAEKSSEDYNPYADSIAKMLYVYALDNEHPVKKVTDDWQHDLAKLMASFVDNNELFTNIEYSSVLDKLKNWMKDNFAHVFELFTQELSKLGYNISTPQKVEARSKSLKCDKELVKVGGKMLNRHFGEIWSFEEDPEEGKIIKFIA